MAGEDRPEYPDYTPEQWAEGRKLYEASNSELPVKTWGGLAVLSRAHWVERAIEGRKLLDTADERSEHGPGDQVGDVIYCKCGGGDWGHEKPTVRRSAYRPAWEPVAVPPYPMPDIVMEDGVLSVEGYPPGELPAWPHVTFTVARDDQQTAWLRENIYRAIRRARRDRGRLGLSDEVLAEAVADELMAFPRTLGRHAR